MRPVKLDEALKRFERRRTLPTITSKAIIDKLIECNGRYEDDPPVEAIIEYQNVFNGETCWSVVYDAAGVARTLLSPHLNNPRLIWASSLGRVTTSPRR